MPFAFLVTVEAATGDTSTLEPENPFVKETFVPIPIVVHDLDSPIICAAMEALLVLVNARDKPTETVDGPFDLVLAPNSI